MKYSNSYANTVSVCLLVLLGAVIHSPAIAGKAQFRAGGNGATVLDDRFDTSFAIEYSGSCLSGGCHETDTQLVDEHANSFMTHVMVKCNACHGTHTADEVGWEKPALTGYYPGVGKSGYLVGDDRCIACHTQTLDDEAHPDGYRACAECHTPHRFSTRNLRQSR